MRTMPARNPRTECCCQSVAVTRDAIVTPAGVFSIAMMRTCLVLDCAAGFDDAGAGRLRDAGLPVFRGGCAGRSLRPRFGLGHEILRGKCGVNRRTTSAPPGQNHPAGRGPEARLSRPKSPQQRSDQARKPANSEQDSCSLVQQRVVSKEPLALIRRLGRRVIGRRIGRLWACAANRLGAG